MENTSAAGRLRLCLTGKTRGFRGPQGERQMVEVVAGDLAEACAKVAAPDDVVSALARGVSATRPERKVVVYADSLFHLIEKAEGSSEDNP